jgi:SAM-dependent MidA family methyltransferase
VSRYRPWEPAWAEALYGPTGFYLRAEGPAGHFRTAAHAAGRELAEAVIRLATEHGCTAIVDIGAGRGELLTALAGATGRPPILWGADVVPRPAGLPPAVGWSTVPTTLARAGAAELSERELAGALVMGWELLDVVPCPILELDADGGPREVLVESATGRERLGAPALSAERGWCERWWPVDDAVVGDRVEVGAPREEFWAQLVRQAVTGGARALLAVDYAHQSDTRPKLGSLTGFRAGRAVPPRPDGTMDVTAHVAIDAVAAAGLAAGAASSELTSQHAALRALGVRNAELLEPGGLGGFSWLLQRLTLD